MSDIAVGIRNGMTAETEIFRRISWGAIFAGVLVALSLELVFLIFGLFIGFQMSGGAATAWTEIWYFVGVFFSLMIGSWVTARMTGNPNRSNGMLHGLVVWGLTMFTTTVAAVILLWDTIRLASSFVQTAISTVPAAPTGAAQANLTQAAAHAASDVSSTALVIFGGLLLAIIGSLLGGAFASPRDVNFLGFHRHLPEQPHHA